MTAARASRIRVALAATLAVAVLPALLGCGGGDELSPPVPVATGSGMATVTLGGVDLGETPLVRAVISEAADSIVPITGEAVTFAGDPPVADLSRRNMAPDLPPCQLVVEDASAPGTFYFAGADFQVDFVNGSLTALPDGLGGYLVPDGTAVSVNYCALETIFSVAVGVTLPAGDSVGLTFYNLPAGASGMRNTNVTANSPPSDGSFAWNVAAITDLTLLNSTDYRLVDDPAQNDGTIIAADLTNRLNPCLEGRVVAVMEEEQTRDEYLLEVNFNDPECP